MKTVLEFANNVLENGRDPFRANPTPLFADVFMESIKDDYLCNQLTME